MAEDNNENRRQAGTFPPQKPKKPIKMRSFKSEDAATKTLVLELNLLKKSTESLSDESKFIAVQKFITDLESAIQSNNNDKVNKIVGIMRNYLPGMIGGKEIPVNLNNALTGISHKYPIDLSKTSPPPSPESTGAEVEPHSQGHAVDLSSPSESQSERHAVDLSSPTAGQGPNVASKVKALKDSGFDPSKPPPNRPKSVTHSASSSSVGSEPDKKKGLREKLKEGAGNVRKMFKK